MELQQCLKIVNMELPYDPAISLLVIYPKGMKAELNQLFVHLSVLQHYS